LISVAALASSKKSVFLTVFSLALVVLAYFVRPAMILFIPIVIIQFRYGSLYALIATLPLIIGFNINTDLYDILERLSSLAEDEGAGETALLIRQYTFGYGLYPVLTKIGLLSLSFLFQPILAIIKSLSGTSNFIIFEGLAFGASLAMILYQRLLPKFFLASLPYVVIVGSTSPFYHFRYLAITFPIIWIYALRSKGSGWSRHSSVRSALMQRRRGPARRQIPARA
jgi:hypothetical protein